MKEYSAFPKVPVLLVTIRLLCVITGYSLEWSYLSAEMQSAYTTAPTDWALQLLVKLYYYSLFKWIVLATIAKVWTTMLSIIWKFDLSDRKKKNKQDFFQSVAGVHTTVWMNHMDVNKMLGEKARWELHKNAMSHFEQILVLTPYETNTVWSPNSHQKHYQRKTIHCWRSKDKLMTLFYESIHMDVHVLADQQELICISIGHRM